MNEKEIRFIDLFGGVGGFRYGLDNCNSEERRKERIQANTEKKNNVSSEKTGRSLFRCATYYEIDKYAVQIYNKNFKENNSPIDITKVASNDIPKHDLLCAGFPCQSFSIAGKRRGFEDTRGTLFFEIARILKDKKPEMVLLENVKGLLSHDEGRTFGTIIKTLSELGYVGQYEVLNSKNFGVPQNRERIFIFCTRGKRKLQVFPIGEINEKITSTQKDKRKETKTMIQMIGGSQGQRVYNTKGISQCISLSSGGQGRSTGLYMVQGIAWSKSHRTGKTKTDKRRHNYGRIEERIKMNEFNALTTGQGGSSQSSHNFCITNNKIRRLTPTECERLQGFPDGWTEGISDTQRYKMMGNAVTTNVITAIGENILKEVKT